MITEILKNRFCQNMTRHPDLEWDFVEDRLNENKEVLEVLKRMEESGGEPDAIGIDESSGKIIFCDCSSETPAGRRSLCYDDEALEIEVLDFDELDVNKISINQSMCSLIILAINIRLVE